jgi:hypothetical protein
MCRNAGIQFLVFREPILTIDHARSLNNNSKQTTTMDDAACRVLDYLAYKNKIKANEWTERLWQQHLAGTPVPPDFRPEEDRQRYGELIARVEHTRSLARKLHARRMAHAPRFAGSAGQPGG